MEKKTKSKPVAKKPKPPIPSPPITPTTVVHDVKWDPKKQRLDVAQSTGAFTSKCPCEPKPINWCCVRRRIAYVFNHALALAAYAIVGFVAVNAVLDDYAGYNPVGNSLLALACAFGLWLPANIKLYELGKKCS